MQGHVTVDAVEERCVLVGVITSETSEEVAQEHLDELEFLAETAGAITVEKFFQNCLIRIRALTSEPANSKKSSNT